ncbi:MAG TPA: hypothetical protein ENJ19_07810 [Gammaproteobacteria bacterium]|nr:hypothetical protein [Gammaproteobacteria bacterium]
MKKGKGQAGLRREYGREDLGKASRGKCHEACNNSHKLVLVEREVAKAFPDANAVNEALKPLIKVASAATGYK